MRGRLRTKGPWADGGAVRASARSCGAAERLGHLPTPPAREKHVWARPPRLALREMSQSPSPRAEPSSFPLGLPPPPPSAAPPPPPAPAPPASGRTPGTGLARPACQGAAPGPRAPPRSRRGGCWCGQPSFGAETGWGCPASPRCGVPAVDTGARTGPAGASGCPHALDLRSEEARRERAHGACPEQRPVAAGTRPPLWSWSQQRGWGSGCSMQAGARPGKVPNVPLGAGPRGSRLTEGTPTPARPTCGSPPFSQTCPGLHTSGDPGAVPVKMLLLCPWSSGDSGLASHTPRWALSQLRHAGLGRRRLVPILSETDQTPCSQDRPRPTCHRTPSTLTRPPRATGGPQGRTGLGEKTPSRAWSLGSCDVLPRPSCCRPHLPDSGPTAPGPCTCCGPVSVPSSAPTSEVPARLPGT